MVTPLVSEHVHLGERATRGTVVGTQRVEERGVDVDPLLRRAVERAGSGRCGAALRLRLPAEQCNGLRAAVVADLRVPVAVQRVARRGHAALDVRVRVGAGLAVLDRDDLLARRRPAAARAQCGGEPREIHSEQLGPEEQHDHEADTAATDSHARTAATAAALLHLTRVDANVLVESHARMLSRQRRIAHRSVSRPSVPMLSAALWNARRSNPLWRSAPSRSSSQARSPTLYEIA